MTSMTESELFLEELGRGMNAATERLIVCAFAGDPNVVEPRGWRPRPWAPGRALELPRAWNAYVTVSSFRRWADGTFRRRTEGFGGGLALMVDDVGTKVSRATVESMPPSARIETSAGNEQWWYFLERAERDAARFDALIRAFIAGKLLGADPGMAGVNRVGRLPGFCNGKEAYREQLRGGPWVTRLLELNGERRFSVEQLLEGFGLALNGRRDLRAPLPTEEALERNRAFAVVYRWLRERRMLKKMEPDPSGWTEMHCPWMGEHTAAADTGAAVREPSPENDYWGGFRCHHGHCADRGWSDLTEWVAERSAEELEAATND